MKKSLLAGFIILILCKPVSAVEEVIAHFENPKGKTFFAQTKLVFKEQGAGWQDSGIKNGISEVVLIDGNLDVRFIDSSKGIKSALAQGARIMTYNKGNKEATILVMYPLETIEIFTFYIDNKGQKKFIMTQAKSGEEALITQSSIFTGSCDFVYFDKFPG